MKEIVEQTMVNRLKQYYNSASSVLSMLGILFILLNVLIPSVATFAQTSGSGNCTQGKIGITDIFAPTSFVPIIETKCSTDAKGKAIPLSFEVLPYVLLRGYGFLSSLIVYIFGFILIFTGIQYSYGALDRNSGVRAMKNIQDSVVAILLVFSTYAIINTLIIVLKVPGFASNASLTSFFVPIK